MSVQSKCWKYAIYHRVSRLGLGRNSKVIFSLSMPFSDFNIHMILSSILQTLTLKTRNSLRWYNNYQALNFDVYLICTFSSSKVIFIKTKHSTKEKNKRKKRDNWGYIEGEWSASMLNMFSCTALTPITKNLNVLFILIKPNCRGNTSNIASVCNIHVVSKRAFFFC